MNASISPVFEYGLLYFFAENADISHAIERRRVIVVARRIDHDQLHLNSRMALAQTGRHMARLPQS
jgi:hypothetical protein